MLKDIAISTAAFCLWDIGPKRKMNICKSLGFERIVIAFSTQKMLKQFSASQTLCDELAKFKHVMIHAPWCGIHYKDNKATTEVFGHLKKIMKTVDVEAVIFHFDCIKDWKTFEKCDFSYYIKNPNHASWQTFDAAKCEHAFESVLDINRAIRFEDYIDDYLDHHGKQVKAIHVSGFVEDLGRMPIAESGQASLLEKVKHVNAPIVIEGLFSPGDFQGIREEIEVIKSKVLGLA